jgi:hypothetical protein
MSMSVYWSLSFWLSHSNTVCISLLPKVCCMPSHLILLDLLILIIFGEQYKFLIAQFSPTSYYFICLRSKHSFQHSSQTPSVYILPLMSKIKLHTHTKLQEKYGFIYFNIHVLKQQTRR